MNGSVARWLALLAAVLLVLHHLPASAEEQLKDDPRARQFFEVGAQAYAKGQYLLALDAFKEAYALTQRPGLLFSIAQAHQRQFRATGDELHLTQAIDNYRSYLARVPNGGRHDEASALLNALLATAERLHPVDRASPARTQVFGRLLLSSGTPEARITVNGEAVETLPTALELPADKYRVVATGPGYESHIQEISIVAGSTVPLNLDLRPLPAKLQVSGPAGAEVFVDGRSVGWLPMSVLQLEGGEHWVSLRRSGRKTRSALVRLQRGQTAQLELPLETTLQRDAAWVVAAGALVGLAVTVPLALVANARDNEAESLDDRRLNQGISVAEGARLNDALDARDELRSGATVAGIATGALIGSALLLYFADTPAPPWGGAKPATARNGETEFTMSPWLGSSWGVGASVRF